MFVNYILGGCGAMFEINVIAPEFKGLNTVKQHRIINEVSISSIPILSKELCSHFTMCLNKF